MKIQWLQSIMTTTVAMHKSSYVEKIPGPLKFQTFPGDYVDLRLKLMQRSFKDVATEFTETFDVSDEFREKLETILFYRDGLSHGYINLSTSSELIQWAPNHSERMRKVKPPLSIIPDEHCCALILQDIDNAHEIVKSLLNEVHDIAEQHGMDFNNFV